MHRNKPNSHKKKQQNQTRDVRDIHLPRSESPLDILYNFDDIENVTRRENAVQVRDLSDKDLTKSKKYKLHLNSPPELRISKDNEKTAACLPLLLQTSRQEKAWNLSENRKISKGRKQGSESYGPDIGTVNGKKLSNSITCEYHNLRPYLPLLTLCQCPDYDSAVIEVVRDYNDPCRGVASLIYPASNP